MQLRMLFDVKNTSIPAIQLPEEFELRSLRSDETDIWGSVLHPACGFSVKDAEYMKIYGPRLLPNGIKGVFERATGRLLASASAQYCECGVQGGLGWVMALPEMRGRKLGAAVSAAAMQTVADNGFKTICLATDDNRLPALKMYLAFGWRPWLYFEDMPERWKNICKNLQIAPGSLENYTLDELGSIIVRNDLA